MKDRSFTKGTAANAREIQSRTITIILPLDYPEILFVGPTRSTVDGPIKIIPANRGRRQKRSSGLPEDGEE